MTDPVVPPPTSGPLDECFTEGSARADTERELIDFESDAAPVVPLPEQQGESETKMSGIGLIATERQRQIEVEGWTSKHDAEHSEGDLEMAALCYLEAPRMGELVRSGARIKHGPLAGEPWTPTDWPWDARYWKPTPDDRVRELVKAGALIAAEIDRLNARPTFDFPPGTDPWADLHQGRASS